MSKADKLKPVTKASKADAWLEPKGEKIVEKTAKKDVVPPKFSRLQYYACKSPFVIPLPLHCVAAKHLFPHCNFLLVLRHLSSSQ
jgi:hypothetical protein